MEVAVRRGKLLAVDGVAANLEAYFAVKEP
jgi:hypothetical protein